MFRIKRKKQSQVIVKKSKFLGFAFYVTNEAAIQKSLAEVKAQYKDAKHVVYAYRFLDKGVQRAKFNNDKEPSGSAGQPLLYLLQKKEINNCLLVVVRYFGGIKLGVGGLMRAYTQAGQDTLERNICVLE